jgi:hypothetical protein
MADLVDKSGQLVSVPDEQAGELVASGEFGLRSDRPVNLVDSQGRVVNAEAVDATKLLSGGKFRLALQPEIQSDLERQEFEGRTIEAGATALARGATLGLSDVALDSLSPGYGQQLLKLEEYNPGVSLAGEIGGTVAGTLLTGGLAAEGALARGVLGTARAATAPVRVAAGLGARAGEVAATAAKSLLGSRAAGALGRAAVAGAQLGAEGAVEGAVSAAAQAAARDYLTDHEITAERIVTGAGWGGLLGGAGGGVLGATGSLTASAGRQGWDSLAGAWGKRADAPPQTSAEMLNPPKPIEVEPPVNTGGFVADPRATEQVAGMNAAELARATADGSGRGRYTLIDVPIDTIDVQDVWSESKMPKIRQGLKEGAQLPPVRLTVGDNGRLSIEDGIHRVNAVREAGGTHVPAIVEEFVPAGAPEPPALSFSRSQRLGPEVEEIAANPIVAQESRPLVAGDMLQAQDEQSVQALRRAALAQDRFETVQQGAVKAIGDDLDGFLRADDLVRERAGIAGKKAWLRSNISGLQEIDPLPYRQMIENTLQSAQQKMDELGPYILGERGGGAVLQRVVLESRDALKRVDKSLAEGKLDDVFDTYDEHKRFLGHAQYTKNQKVQEFARAEYERARAHLEDEALYGKFATMQKHVNPVKTEEIRRTRDGDLSGLFTRSGNASEDPFELLDKTNRQSLGSTLNQLGVEELREKEATIRRYLRAKVASADVWSQYFGDAASKAAAASMRDQAQRIEDQLTAVALTKRDAKRWERTRKALEGIPLVGGAIVKGAETAARAVQTAERVTPSGAIGAATRGQEATQSASKGFLRALRENVSKSASKIRRAARPAFASTVILGVRQHEKERDQKVAARVRELSDPGSQARARIRENLAPVRLEEPARAAAFEAQVQRTADFLAHKASETFREAPSNDLWARMREQRVDPVARERFAVYAHAAENPKAVLDAIAKGDVSREEIETLRELYPRLYGQVVQDVMHGLADLKELPSYRERVKLGILLGAPTDPTMQPQNVAQYQQLAQEQASAVQPASPPRSPPKVAGQYSTQSERVLGAP